MQVLEVSELHSKQWQIEKKNSTINNLDICSELDMRIKLNVEVSSKSMW